MQGKLQRVFVISPHNGCKVRSLLWRESEGHQGLWPRVQDWQMNQEHGLSDSRDDLLLWHIVLPSLKAAGFTIVLSSLSMLLAMECQQTISVAFCLDQQMKTYGDGLVLPSYINLNKIKALWQATCCFIEWWACLTLYSNYFHFLSLSCRTYKIVKIELQKELCSLDLMLINQEFWSVIQ